MDLITCLPLYIEVSAICVKLKVKRESIGEKAAFLASIYVNNTKQKWRTEKNPRNSQNILLFYHPDEQGNIENFKIQVESVFKKPLTRQKTEAVKIQSSRATHIMNSKAEHRQPAMLRVRMTRDNDDDGTNSGQQQGGRGGRGNARRRVGE